MEQRLRKLTTLDAHGNDSLEIYQRRAYSQLAKSLGDDEARVLLRDVLLEVGVERVRTADDLLRLGVGLMNRGGVAEVVGRSIKVHAVLKGARVTILHEHDATATAR